MIYIDTEKCAGCGVCADACPVGAISLVSGIAKVDQEKCTDCEVCVEACPNRAILAVREPVTVPSVRPAPEVIRVRPRPAPVSLPARAVPAVSAAAAALTYLGRNIAPRLADYLLHALERRLSRGQASPAAGTSGSASPASSVGGRRPSTVSGVTSGRGPRRRRRRGRGW